MGCIAAHKGAALLVFTQSEELGTEGNDFPSLHLVPPVSGGMFTGRSASSTGI
ncbi:MAG: hypothetical protein GXO75_11255 [Calditrichaeota bacterium]|nr:hypothetical protein [Calditrichota bacterium]